MFELTKEEFSNWRTQFATSNADKMGLRVPPFAFTEYGVLMPASVLNSERAIQVNIQIIKIFTKMCEMLLSHKDILIRLEKIEHTLVGHDDKIMLIFEYLKQLEKTKQEELDQKNRYPIGYKK